MTDPDQARNGAAASTTHAGMDPRKLLYFATIVEQGSFKKAAKTLAVSQPALSTSMDRFEHGLGSQLLLRSPAGVTPTTLGEAVYAHARLIREELERAERRLTETQIGQENVITFGVLPSLATEIVPKAVCRWRKDHETTVLKVVQQNQLDLVLGLLRGELDFIIAQTELYGFLEGMRQRVLFRDRLYVLARPSHPAHNLAAPLWSDLAEFPWIVQMVGRQRTLLEKLLSTEEVELPRQLTESSSVDFIRAMVVGSDNLAMLPAATVAQDVRDGRMMPLAISEPMLNRDIAVLFRDGVTLSPAMRALLNDIEFAGLDHGHDDLDFGNSASVRLVPN